MVFSIKVLSFKSVFILWRILILKIVTIAAMFQTVVPWSSHSPTLRLPRCLLGDLSLTNQGTRCVAISDNQIIQQIKLKKYYY